MGLGRSNAKEKPSSEATSKVDVFGTPFLNTTRMDHHNNDQMLDMTTTIMRRMPMKMT